MKRPNITPGEWKTLSKLNDHMVSNQDHHVLAVATNGNETENARAIASVPKLLAALEPFASFFNGDLADVGGGTLVALSLKLQAFKDAKAALIEAGYTFDTYAKIQPGHPAYERINAIKANGGTACDSLDHNESTGCSNPDCFKHGAFID